MKFVAKYSHTKYGKIWIVPSEAVHKLLKATDLPISNDRWKPIPISMAKGHTLSDEVMGMAGEDCHFEVKIRKYSFVSTLSHNAGQTVSGSHLVLVSVMRP